VPAGQEIALEPALALVLAEHLHDAPVRRQMIIPRLFTTDKPIIFAFHGYRNRDQGAIHHLGLVHMEYRRARIVIEVTRDIGLLGVAQDTLELLLGGAFHRAVNFILGGRTCGLPSFDLCGEGAADNL
jgi:XFP C-terminal domain